MPGRTLSTPEKSPHQVLRRTPLPGLLVGLSETLSSQGCHRKQEAPWGEARPLPHKPGSGWQKERYLARPGAPGLAARGPPSGGARSQVPWGPRPAFHRGLQRPPLKGAEEQLGTRTKRPGPPRRKEGASPRKQLIALSSACFFLCSTVLLPRQTKDVRSRSLPCLDCAADWLCFLKSWRRGVAGGFWLCLRDDGKALRPTCPRRRPPGPTRAPRGPCSL